MFESLELRHTGLATHCMHGLAAQVAKMQQHEKAVGNVREKKSWLDESPGGICDKRALRAM